MSDSKLNSVSGVLKVLKRFVFDRDVWGPRELGRALGLSKSTTMRILQTLADENFLISTEKDGKYRIGPGLWRLGLALGSVVSLSTIVTPILRKYVGMKNETMHFFTHEQGKVIFDGIVECTHELRYHLNPGIPYPIEKGAAGKVILAFLPTRSAHDIIEELGSRADVNVDGLLKKVEQTRRDGYSFTYDERDGGVVGFAAPVLGSSKNFRCGIGLAVPTVRYQPEDHAMYAHHVMACAAEISSILSADLEQDKGTEDHGK